MHANIRQAIHRAAQAHDLPRDLIAAMVQVESAGDPWAVRAEPGYRWLWNVERGAPTQAREPDGFPAPDRVSPSTEYWGQKHSWGLMQIMGAVAREHGYQSPYFTTLCEPDVGLRYGCKLLIALYDRHHAHYGWEGVVSAYNSGRPDSRRGAAYAEKVRHAGGL